MPCLRSRLRALTGAGVLCALGPLGMLACGDKSPPTPQQPQGARKLAEPVVARVNGDEIGLSDVTRLCAASGLTPRLSLSRLIDERLLAQHAAERGYGDLHDTQRALKKAQVRALLSEAIEDPSGEAPAAAEARSKYEALIRELQSKTKVVYDEDAVRQALSDDGTLGPGT